jgi:hypothetical protein
MWSRGAVVIIKHGDEGIGNAVESGYLAKSKIPEEYKKMEKEYTIMKVGRESEIQEKIRKANNQYGRKPTLLGKIGSILMRPIITLEVIYAMTVCGIEFLFGALLSPEDSRKKQRL